VSKFDKTKGYKDRNGKDIKAGDLLDYKEGDDYCRVEAVLIVRWGPGGGDWGLLDDSMDTHDYTDNPKLRTIVDEEYVDDYPLDKSEAG